MWLLSGIDVSTKLIRILPDKETSHFSSGNFSYAMWLGRIKLDRTRACRGNK